MNPEVVAELRRLGMAYDYPQVRLVDVGATVRDGFKPNGSPLPSFGSSGLTFVPAVVVADCRTFERSIAEDLRSEDINRIRLGFASVVFWGHYSDDRGHNRAATRADVTCLQDADDLRSTIGRMIERVDAGGFGEALVASLALKQIGSTSFGSKVVTFLAPDRAGVFDQQIYNGLARMIVKSDPTPFESWLAREYAPWAWTAFIRAGDTKLNLKRGAAGFDRWCAALAGHAEELNEKGVPGPHGKWLAADVERAIFKALRTGRRG